MPRRLLISEWKQFEQLYKRVCPEDQVPSPTNSIVVAEFDGEDIVGFTVGRMVLHLDPVWVRPDHRGGTVLLKMCEIFKSTMPGLTHAFAFVLSEAKARLFSKFGMEYMEKYKVLRWRA